MTDNKLNIALIGYGKMGKIIEKIAIQRGHSIGLAISSSNRSSFTKEALADIDVAIEFTTPEIAAENLLLLAETHVPTVCGTTAWLDRYEEITESVMKHKSALLYASNFSIGVNIFFALNKHLAKLMTTQETYDISMKEAHHITKVDAPSGTAVTLANQVMAELSSKTKWSLENKDADSIHIEVRREKDVKGMHELSYSSSIDTLSIKHEAHSREGFALGAVMAAEFLKGKEGVYSMEDVLSL